MDEIKVDVAKLKQLRIKRGISVATASEYLGFGSAQGYYYKETGTSQITAVELGKLADLYGVTADELLTRTCELPA